jgi:hypothetical protein
MTTTTRTLAALVSVLLISVAAAATPAQASVAGCSKSLTKETQKLTALKAKALQSCEDKRASGSLPPATVCRTESATALSVAKASGKARTAMVKACCGPDRECGNGDDESLTQLGWGSSPTCPNFENGQQGSCTNAIDDPGDVADCLLCVAGGATDQLLDLVYRAPATNPGATAIRCRRALGKATVKFFQAKSRILEKCWEKRINGAHGQDCPTPGDGKATGAIASAEAKMARAICNACGGDDGICNGTGDVAPSAIAFPASCPDVVVPNDGGSHGGEACGGPVSTFADVVACVTCVAEFKVDCVDDLAVRRYESYDPACNLGIAPTPTPGGGVTATPTPVPTFTPNPNCGNGVRDAGEECDPTAPAAGQPCHPSVCVPTGLPAGAGAEYACSCATGSERTVYAQGQLDNGWTGTSQNTATVDHTVVDLLLFGCDGTSDPECLIYGPRPGPYGFRCELNARMACATTADCGGNGRCGQFLGPPLPLSSGGIPVCVTSFFDRPVSGTLNVSNGTTESRSFLKAIVHLAQAVDAPCARCNCSAPLCLNQVGDAGLCSGGPAVGQACTIEGVSDFGPVSLDCPPLSSTNISGTGLDVRFLPTTTGTSSLDVSLPCTDPSAAGYLCPCDTCGGGPTPNAPCHTDADCGAGGVCGAKRCSSGSSVGQICTSDANCPGGTLGSCGRPGLATKPNACNLGCNGGPNNNQACTSNADCPSGACLPLCRQNGGQEIGEGACILGPTDGFCSLETFRGCSADLQCAPPPLGTCLGCQLGQTCTFQNRACHVFPIQLQGQAGAFVAGSSTGESVNSFCIPPTSSDAVNQTSGIPGEGVIVVPHTLTVQFPAAAQ